MVDFKDEDSDLTDQVQTAVESATPNPDSTVGKPGTDPKVEVYFGSKDAPEGND